MNKKQKEVMAKTLKSEEAVIEDLKKQYRASLRQINAKIRELQGDELTQSKIYQIDYQRALKGQIEAILDNLNGTQYTTINEYLKNCYQDGYLGVMYDLQGQDIPLIIPIDQEQVAAALVNDTKLSTSLYTALGKHMTTLKKQVNQEISRGIASALMYADIARNVNARTNVGINNAIRIARTEGHRVQQEAAYHAQQRAKEAGADIVKQWDSTMDGRTRSDHRMLDGQIRELDEPFEVNGHKAMYPGNFGVAKEDINCRCVVLQRARWALDEEELATLKEKASFWGLDKSKDFEEFEQKYLSLDENADKINMKILDKPIEKSNDKYYDTLLNLANNSNITYRPVQNLDSPRESDEIIKVLAGGDETTGSCASLGLAYIGQRQGWDVIDYRGGASQRFFSSGMNLYNLSKTKGMKTFDAAGKTQMTFANNLLKQCEVGHEYYLCCGRHAAIVRKLEDGKLQYLELQSATDSGWTAFDGNPRYTLKTRFGCSPSREPYGDFMIDIDESDFSSDEFKSLLGYLNTAEDAQRKGKYGSTK